MNKNVRKITDGAMMVAIIGMVILCDRLLGGLLLANLYFFLPLPIVVYSSKYELKYSVMVWASMCIISFIIGGLATFLTAFFYYFVGLVYGHLVYKGVGGYTRLLVIIGISTIVNVLQFTVFAGVLGYDIMSEISSLKDMMNEMGLSYNDSMLYMGIRVGILMMSVLESLTIHLASFLLLHKLGFKLKKDKPMILHFPRKIFGYLAIVGFFLWSLSIGGMISNNSLQVLVEMFGAISLLYLIFYGIMALVLTLMGTGLPRGVCLAIGIILGIMLGIVTMMLGFLYITTNFHYSLLERIGIHVQ